MKIPLLLFILSSPLFAPSHSQPSPLATTALAPAPDCTGILLTFSISDRTKIRPYTTSPANQPYAFTATATVLNSNTAYVVAWSLLLDFQHRELLVSLDGAVIVDGSDFPYNTTVDTGNSTSLSGYPNTILKTPIETANDITQIKVLITIKNTLFDAALPSLPLPPSLEPSPPPLSPTMDEMLTLRGTLRRHTDIVTAIVAPVDNSDSLVSSSRYKSLL